MFLLLSYRKPYKRIIFLVMLIGKVLIPFAVLSQSTTSGQSITIRVESTKEMIMKSSDMDAMKHIVLKARDKDGLLHTYSGVPVIALLEQAGLPAGERLKGGTLRKFVLIEAADGYETVFSLPELDPQFTDNIILLCDKQDDKPLLPAIGPYRIVVPGDKKHTRWVRKVTAIRVLDAKNDV